MAGGGPLAVREYGPDDVARMKADALALRNRMFAPIPTPPPRHPAPKLVEVKPFVVPGKLSDIIDIPPPNRELTTEAYLKAMKGLRANHHKMRSLVRIVTVVTGVPIEMLLGEGRGYTATKARHIGFYLGHVAGYSHPNVVTYFGRTDHTTSMAGVRRVQRVIKDLSIKVVSDPVVMAQKLWDAEWPRGGEVGRK